jgi:hypothetical protein
MISTQNTHLHKIIFFSFHFQLIHTKFKLINKNDIIITQKKNKALIRQFHINNTIKEIRFIKSSITLFSSINKVPTTSSNTSTTYTKNLPTNNNNNNNKRKIRQQLSFEWQIDNNLNSKKEQKIQTVERK